jgi:nitroreductase
MEHTPNYKIADTDIAILDIIKNRWSPRSFIDKVPDRALIVRLLEAARWAASSYNEQPWRFIIGLKGDASYSKLYDCMGEYNQNWAGKAPVLLLACSKKTFTKSGEVNRHYTHDMGQAMAFMALQAVQEKMQMHQMAGFSRTTAEKKFNIPEGFEPVTMAAFGYPATPEDLPDDLQKSERAQRNRKSLSEIVFTENWDNAF